MLILKLNFGISLLTLLALGRGDFPPPPKAFRRTFPYEAMVRGGCNYTLNSSFVITQLLKLVSVQKSFRLLIAKCIWLNPIPRGGGHICPPYHISAIFSGRTYPRRLQLYSKFKFCNYRAPEIGFGSKKFSYGAWDAAKVGWVVDILLRFCLKIGCNFSFHEMR